LNLVSSANGRLTFSIKDLEISGAMPISFTRVYASDKSQDTGLGAGWSPIPQPPKRATTLMVRRKARMAVPD